MQVIRTLLLTLLVLLFTPISFAVPPPASTIDVNVGIFINDITNIDVRNELITLEGTLTSQWHDKRLGNTSKQQYVGKAALEKLSNIWHPYFKMMHTRGKTSIETSLLSIKKNGLVKYTERFSTVIESHINLQRFPFDKQYLNIIAIPLTQDGDNINLKMLKDAQGISKKAHSAEWNILNTRTLISQTTYNNKKSAPQYTLQIDYQRKANFYIFKIMLPLMIIVALTWLVFWMSKEVLVNRIRLLFTALLTIVAFQWLILNSTPRVSYYTFLDALITFSFVMISFIMVAVTISDTNLKEKHEAINYHCRWLFPSLYFVGLGLLALHFF